MAKFTSIYGAIPDRARIIWSFLTFIPLVLIVVSSIALLIGSASAYGVLTGAIDMSEAFKAGLSEKLGFSEPLRIALPFASFILCTVFWTRIVENRPIGSIGFSVEGWAPRYLTGFVVGGLFLLTVIGVIYAAGGYTVEQMLPLMVTPDPKDAALFIAAYLFAFLIQGAAEETVFRGWWMSALAARRGRIIALIVTSVIFALSHMGNVYPPTPESMTGVANIVLFGLFIGLYALKEGSLWGVCGWHSAWNWLLGLGFGLEVSGGGVEATPLLVDLAHKDGASLLTGGDFGPEASLVTTAVLTLGCIWFVARGALKAKEA